MAKKSDQNIIVGLDIGTSKVAAIVASTVDDNTVEVIGLARAL